MSAVGWVGLGKLGAPCAAALAQYGNHDVWGYDVRGVDPSDYDWSGLPPINLLDSVDRVITNTDEIVFLAVQTPHAPGYGGETPAPDVPRDFEYAYLINAVRAVSYAALTQRKKITLVIVSTVLPGTFDRELRPLLNGYVTPVYHPFFIAMGTVVSDFINPEITLFGVDQREHADVVGELYRSLHAAPAPVMSITSAELTKVVYNTFISLKIMYANAVGELAEVTGADVDDVTTALAMSVQRITSAAYLTAGVGDGGACHPRDNVALSALAKRHDVSVDVMGFLTRARERQTEWLAELVNRWCRQTGLAVVVVGRSYKPNVEMDDGSPALLLAYYLRERQVNFRHVRRYAELTQTEREYPMLFVLATAHPELADATWPEGSVVIDPFGLATPSDRVTLVTPGRRR
jgi:UDPglucose 6-dehydrogenase